MANRYKEDVAMFYNGGISSKAIVLGEQSVEFKAAKARLEKIFYILKIRKRDNNSRIL